MAWRAAEELMIMKNLADILVEDDEVQVVYEDAQLVEVTKADSKRLEECGWISTMKRVALAYAAEAVEEDMTPDNFVIPTMEVLIKENTETFEGYKAYSELLELKNKDRKVQQNLQETVAKVKLSLETLDAEAEEGENSPEIISEHKQCAAQAKLAMRLMPFLKVETVDEDNFWTNSSIEINSILDGSYGTGAQATAHVPVAQDEEPVPSQVEER